MEDNKKQLLKTIANRLAKGGVKSIPIAGGILEEAIFGVMDAESARRESAKLQFTLQKLQGSVEEQTQSLDALLKIARDQADLNRDARDAVDQMLRKISSTGTEEQIATILEAVVNRQGIDISAVPNDVDALQQEIENKLRPEMLTRAAMIKKLTKLRQAEIDALVATLGAYGIPAKSKMARASELVNWAQRPDGNGIAEIIFAARALDLQGFHKAIPDPQ